ncbi:MAG: hypothetical protein PHH47_01350 [Gallionella sp.]|nr:hypothetical protein [Gallionella sp.]MDD4946117.1 hypothetical protein [Gallionella sp.]
MSEPQKITKEQLLKTIDRLKKNPHDRVGILGQGGITVLGAGLGAAAAGTAASAMGATSIFGLTAAAKVVGVTLVSGTPIGWVLGLGAIGGAAAYGISKLVHSGGISEGRKKELLQKYTEVLKDIEAKERAGDVSDEDKNSFHISLRELIEKDVIAPEKASQLMEMVENGRIPLSQGIQIVKDLLEEGQESKLEEVKQEIQKPYNSVDQQLQRNVDIINKLIAEIEAQKLAIANQNEVLLAHDRALQQAENLVSTLKLQLQKTDDQLGLLTDKVASDASNIAMHDTVIGRHAAEIQKINEGAAKIKLLSMIAVGMSILSAALCVAILIK